MTFTVEATQRKSNIGKLVEHFPVSESREAALVKVPLENTAEIAPTLLTKDYERLQVDGFSGGWFFAVQENGQHDIRIEHNGEYLSAAKVLLGLPESAAVSFNDGSCLNLLPSNLTSQTNKVKNDTKI